MDLSAVAILLTGLGLGFVHSLDADHVVAVTTLVCNNKSLRKSISSAAVWGIGHSTVLLITGSAVLILRIAIPESVVNIFELAAAVLLMILGIHVLRPLATEIIFRRHNETEKKLTHQQMHTHSHLQSPETGDRYENHKHLQKSALTGVLQGMGGTAALALVTLTTVNKIEVGLGFILVFGIGIILGMVSTVYLLGSLIAHTATRLKRVHRIIVASTGSLSIAFGIGIVVSILV